MQMLEIRKSEESSENLTRPTLKFTHKFERASGILHPWILLQSANRTTVVLNRLLK